MKIHTPLAKPLQHGYVAIAHQANNTVVPPFIFYHDVGTVPVQPFNNMKMGVICSGEQAAILLILAQPAAPPKPLDYV